MITGEIAPVTVNVTEAISPVLVYVYTDGSVYINGCYMTVRGKSLGGYGKVGVFIFQIVVILPSKCMFCDKCVTL